MKNYSIMLSLFSFLILSACNKNILDTHYTGAYNYKNAYIVDTIKIADPVRIESLKYGGMYIVSRSTLSSFKNTKSFFLRPDVFRYGCDFFRDIPAIDYPRYRDLDDDINYTSLIKSNMRVKGLVIYEFPKKPCLFILELINVAYHNNRHNAFDVKGNDIFRERNASIVYYKVVFPLCK